MMPLTHSFSSALLVVNLPRKRVRCLLESELNGRDTIAGKVIVKRVKHQYEPKLVKRAKDVIVRLSTLRYARPS